MSRNLHILWITAGLSCDGDSVSVTAAEQPSIEEVLIGAVPGLPKVHLHNPVLAAEVGDESMQHFYKAEKGQLDPYVLVVEGSIPNERIKKEGYWAAFGTNEETGQPITTCEWITLWPAIRPDAWVFPIISAESSGRPADCRSSTSRDAPFSPTTSPRRSFTCSIKRRG